MRCSDLNHWIIAASLVFLLLPVRSIALAGNEPIEDQIAAILADEAGRGKIKVVIFDFDVSFSNPEKRPQENAVKDLRDRLTEEFIATLLGKIKGSGKRTDISLIDRGKLDAILREKNIPRTGPAEPGATELSALAGIDIVITGSIQVSGGSSNVMAKVVRVKDGEILTIVKQDKPDKTGKPSPAFRTPIAVIDQAEQLKIGSWKALPMNVMYDGTLAVTMNVTKGNPIDVIVIPDSEYENVKNNKEVHPLTVFTSLKTKNYTRKARLDSGSYYLILRDSSIGILSRQRSNIEIKVQLEP
ncbi:MAG TPA: CsgG/HfaB family protein [Nitrospirota bacterium]